MILIAIQKSGKKKGPLDNLRPITLLNSLRKALSIVTLNQIRPRVQDHLSKNQRGFLPDRSPADVIWTHRWLTAKAVKEETTIKITGIDTINRLNFFDIVNTIVEEDGH